MLALSKADFGSGRHWQTFVEWAALAIPRSYWVIEFYESQR